MQKITVLFMLLCITTSTIAQLKPTKIVTQKGNDIVIPFEQYQLPNGLTVILHEDHSDPLVHVDVTYHVGSAREEIGKSGFAHFFEHMMFQGSDNVADEQHFKIITESGGTLNGSTNRDRTNYFETVPANQLEKMLWLEADRMGFLLDAVTQKKFEVQRATVKNERGQNYDNRPYGLVGEVTSKNLYPYGHPYSWLTIGYIEDLDRVDVNDLKNFFMRWYGPNNAVLTIGGDIDKKQTLAWVQKLFGSIPRGPEVSPVQVPAAVLQGDRYITLVDNYAKIPMLAATLPTVPRHHPDEAAIDCLADILGGGKSSILYQSMVKTQKALNASASHPTAELAGEFTIRLMPTEGNTLADMEKAVREAIASIAKNGVDAKDVERFKKSQEASKIYRLESVSGKVSELAAYYTFTGDANYIAEDMQRYTKLTVADVMRVFNKYINEKPMVIVSVVPKGQENLIATDESYVVDNSGYAAPDYGYDKLTYNKATDNFDRSKQPPSGKAVSITVPKVEKTTEKLNGATAKMMMSYSNEIPIIALRISMKGGQMVEQNDLTKAGVASLFSSMMNEDTKKYTAEQIADKLDEMGSSVSVSTSFDRINFTVRTLTKNLAATLEILNERMYAPVFDQETFSRIKNQQLESIKNSKTRASTVASEAYDKVLYGYESVLGNPSGGREATVKNIELADIQKYYDAYVGANDLQVVLVGDYDKNDIAQIKNVIKKLPAKNPQIAKMPHQLGKVPAGFSSNDDKVIYAMNIPKAAQTEFRIGYNTGLMYDTKGEYYQSGLMNYPLGGAFNSRINLNLREDKGWTYGARSFFSGDDYSGAYTFSSGIKADASVDALKEVMKELTNYNTKGVDEDEVKFMKSALSQSDARKYETAFQKLGFLSNMLNRDLDVTYVDEQNAVLKKMTVADMNKMAKKWIDPKKMKIVMVGDVSKYEDELKKLGYKIVMVDSNE